MAMSGHAMTAEEREEATERRLAEIEFIQSAYSPEEAHVSEEGAGSGGCCIVRRLELPYGSSHDGIGCETVKVELRLRMPEAYPVREDAILSIHGSLASCPSNPQHVRKAALDAIPRVVDACRQTALEVTEAQGGGEAVWSVLSRAEEWVGTEWEGLLDEHGRNASNARPTSADDSSCAAIVLGRRILYSHHIIANSKRRDIASLTSQYKLGGYMKIGWPGVILVEGDETHCEAFVDEIKRWRWQHLSIRAEERKNIPEGESIDAHRMLPKQFEELGKEDMSVLASRCRDAGLEHLFLACMQIKDHRTVDEGGGERDGRSEDSSYGVLAHVDHMNDAKRYRRWLQKTCQAHGCALFISQFSLRASANNDRPAIYVGIFGDKGHVKKVMKLWRTCKVDVDSRNKACLERMMTVVEEGDIQRIPTNITLPLDEESGLDCSFQEFESLVCSIDEDWALNLRSRHSA